MNTTRIPFLAGRLSEAASRFISDELRQAGHSDLLPCHGDLLKVLLEEESVTVLELAARTHRSKSTVSALAEKLVRLGYVRKSRSAQDSRVVNLTLTPQGRALEPVMQGISEKLALRLASGISPESAAATEAALETLLKKF